jgi:helix-turn-helix protein
MMMLPESNDTVTVTPTPKSTPLTEADAAVRLGLKVATLRAWRHQCKGPAFVRLGRAIRYLTADIDNFLHANRHGPSCDLEK